MVSVNEANSILSVLYSLRDCIERNDTYTTKYGIDFNINKRDGICWHVATYCSLPIKTYKILGAIFVGMGVDSHYPVELQVVDALNQANSLYILNSDKYSTDTDTGLLRRKLLDDLVQYFENIVHTELA